VNNTFGESHNYWLSAESRGPSASAVRYRTPKQLHVSPFMGMQLDYEWIFTPPAERLAAHMNAVTSGSRFFDATLQLERRPWERRELHRVLASYPFMTLRVVAAIHWQALCLWLKQIPVFTHPNNIPALHAPNAGQPFDSKGNALP